MTRKRSAKYPEYAFSDEAAAYIAAHADGDRLAIRGDPFAVNTPVITNPSRPIVMTTTLGNSTCSANIPLLTAGSILLVSTRAAMPFFRSLIAALQNANFFLACAFFLFDRSCRLSFAPTEDSRRWRAQRLSRPAVAPP